MAARDYFSMSASAVNAKREIVQANLGLFEDIQQQACFLPDNVVTS